MKCARLEQSSWLFCGHSQLDLKLLNTRVPEAYRDPRCRKIFRPCFNQSEDPDFNPCEDTDGTINLQVGLKRPLSPGRSRCGGRRATVRQGEIAVGRASRVAETPPASRQRIDGHRRMSTCGR